VPPTTAGERFEAGHRGETAVPGQLTETRFGIEIARITRKLQWVRCASALTRGRILNLMRTLAGLQALTLAVSEHFAVGNARGFQWAEWRTLATARFWILNVSRFGAVHDGGTLAIAAWRTGQHLSVGRASRDEIGRAVATAGIVGEVGADSAGVLGEHWRERVGRPRGAATLTVRVVDFSGKHTRTDQLGVAHAIAAADDAAALEHSVHSDVFGIGTDWSKAAVPRV